MRPIELSKHAFVRMRERFPHVLEIEATVRLEVHAAIVEGRRSKTKPVWASTHARVKATHSIRFVWNAELSRCYAVAEKRMRGTRGLLVVTVLPQGQPEHMERVTLSKGALRQTAKGKHAPRSSRAPNWKEKR